MTTDGNTPSQTDSRVVLFRRRVGGPPNVVKSIIRAAREPPPLPSDLAQFERASERDDYWHRMAVNGVTLACTVVLMVIGIWLAGSMAAMRKNQDCVLMGRPSCAPMDVPLQTRW